MINEIKGQVKRLTSKLILSTAKLVNIDLLPLAYKQIGILNSENEYVSGERYVLESILPKYLNKQYRPIFFDVGANSGEYSLALSNLFPHALIYAFEPNPDAYSKLEKKTFSAEVKCLNLGLGDIAGRTSIYSYLDQKDSQHSSFYRDVFIDLHRSEKIIDFDCQITTLDQFCRQESIDFLDFLKIDVEGHEHSVISGAKELLSQDRIGVIQFEFNEMNIISRTFLRDFYRLLERYDLYRLSMNRLIPLGNYNSDNEIFKFQNILAINAFVYLNTK